MWAEVRIHCFGELYQDVFRFSGNFINSLLYCAICVTLFQLPVVLIK
jgi:hypothetical protein